MFYEENSFKLSHLRDIYKVCICQGGVDVVPHVGNYIGHEVAKGKLGRDADLELNITQKIGRSNLILQVSICCLRDVAVKIQRW